MLPEICFRPSPVPRICGIVLLSFYCWTSGFAQFPEGLPETAEESWDQGLDAFRQGDWDAAIRNLVAVQEAAPKVPAVIYNLALSYDFVGFRELLAIGWLNTYVVAAPDAPNIGQTRTRIGDLDDVAVNRLASLFRSAKIAAEPLADSEDPTDRITAYDRIAQAQAQSRVMAREALITADEIQGLCMPCSQGRPEEERNGVLQRILEVQIGARDLDDAFDTAGAIDAGPLRDDAFRDVALSFARRTDGVRSEAAIGQIQDSIRREAARAVVEGALASGTEDVPRDENIPDLDRWSGFMRDFAPSLEEVSGVFPDGAGETEPLAIVDTLTEAASAYGQELARLREMQNVP